VLRLSIIGVAVSAFLFGSLYRQVDYIRMWWDVTIAIFVSGAGATISGVILEEGDDAAAWASLLTGSHLRSAGLLAQHIFAGRFPLNGQQISFGAALVFHWFTLWSLCLPAGAISIWTGCCTAAPTRSRRSGRGDRKACRRRRFRGSGERLASTDDFTRGDRWIAGSLGVWSFMWVANFCSGNGLEPDQAVATFGLVHLLAHRGPVGLPIFLR